MKRKILYGIALLAVIFASCQVDREGIPGMQQKVLNLQVEIDQMGTGLQSDTRSIIVDNVAGETKVNNLHLLFFKKAADGSSATYSGYYKIDNEIDLDTKFEIDYNKANDGNYSVLAFANTDGYFIDSPTLSPTSLDEFLGSLNPSKTEEDVIKETSLYVRKVDASDDYTDQVIVPDKLIMSGRTVKAADEQLITLKLTRAVTRFDVQILDSEYELAAVSIWNNALNTPMWLTSGNASGKVKVNPGRFYGITAADPRQIKGGLYAFENYTPDPKVGDKVTTCLLVGLRPTGTQDKPEYYRVNINPEESGQSLKRNYVYQLTIRKRLGAGGTKQEAYESNVDPNLDTDINNWNLDEEGVILTDGKNTLAIPSKIIRFAQEGGTRNYTIFTQGEGILTMTPNIPSGFTVTLNGNNLQVNADPLGSLTKREGTLDVSFAGLKATIQIIQEPKESDFLRVDKSIISGLPATVGGNHVNNVVKVTSSQNWTAQIYNTGGSKFSFVQGGSSVLKKDDVASGENLEIFVSETNPTNKVLTGFVLISLKNKPQYNRVVMLKQSAATGISIGLGSLTELVFYANGAPKTITGSRPGDYYEFEIDPGTDDNGNFHEWNALLEGPNATKFEIKTEKHQSVNRVIVRPIGNTTGGTPDPSHPYYNLTPNIIDDVKLVVYWGDDRANAEYVGNAMYKEVPVSQEALIFNVAGTTISKAGEIKDLQMSTPDGFTWKAKIKSNWATSAKYGNMEHKGFMMNGENRLTEVADEVTGQSGGVLKVGFDKILFPIVNVEPVLELEVSLEGVSGYSTTVKVTQEELFPKPVNILNAEGGTYPYGSIKTTSALYFMGKYIEMINSTNLFSPTLNGAAIYTDFIKKPTGVDSYDMNTTSAKRIAEHGYNYVHAGYSKNGQYWKLETFNELERWRKTIDGVMVIVQDYDDSRYSASNYWNKLTAATGYQESSYSYTGNGYFDGLTANRLIRYLYQDGPFGVVTLSDMGNCLTGVDPVHSAVTRESVEVTGTTIITEQGNVNSVLVFIDPDKKIVFIGEIQLFSASHFSPVNINGSNATASQRARSRFFANFLSYIIRAAQYGSHFTDHFKKNSETYYPFDQLKVANREPMFQ